MDFLQYLATFLGCEYLSDLHFIKINGEQGRQILAFSEKFSLKEYNDAAQYITGKREMFSTPSAAKQAIVKELTGR